MTVMRSAVVALRSVGTVAVTMLLVLVTVFVMINAAPGDPVTLFVGVDASEEVVAQVQRDLGLDQPLAQRFLTSAGNILRGDFGVSLAYRQPVLDLIVSGLGATLLLVGSGFAASVVLGVGLGLVAGWRRGTLWDRAVNAYSYVFYSQPEFLTGVVIMIVFAAVLPFIPTSGMGTPGVSGWAAITDTARHLIAPTLALAFARSALYARIARISVIRVAEEDYVRTHRAYGFSERFILLRYALRNAILPIISTMGVELRYLFAGAVVVEVIYSWPGLGRLLFNAIIGRDYPLILGLFVVVSAITIAINLITDVLYGVLDPRIRR